MDLESLYETILFSDRPERIVESVSTTDFVGNWSAGQNSFSADEPNDALIVENTQTGQLETAIIESFSPVYDMATTQKSILKNYFDDHILPIVAGSPASKYIVVTQPSYNSITS